jgi:hypothetical protein
MSLKLGEILKDLILKAGYDPKEAQFSDMLSIQTEMPREVAESFGGLMSIDAAKNNTTIKNYFYAMAYAGSDREMLKLADAFEFEEEQKTQLKEERSSGKKYEIFGQFVKDKISSIQKEASAAKKAGDKDAEKLLNDEITKLRDTLAKKDEEKTSAILQKEQEHKNYILNNEIDSAFNGIKWSENYAPEMRSEFARVALNKTLDKMGAKVVLDDKGKPKVVKAENTEFEYFDSSNKRVIFTELAAKVAAENKFLAVSPTQTPNTHQRPVAPLSGNQPNTTTRSNAVQSLIQKSLKDQGGIQ